MSFIDTQRNLAFVHVSKTSAAVEWAWRDACSVATAPGESRLMKGPLWIGGAHDCARDMRRLVPELWNPAFKVGFIRNPWAWWYSAYHWYNPPRHSGFDFEQRFPTFREFLLRRAEWRPRFPWDGYRGFLCDGRKLLVDFVGRTERLQEDFDFICRRTGFPPQILRSKERVDYRPMYEDNLMKAAVYDLSRLDIEFFGYTFDNIGQGGMA